MVYSDGAGIRYTVVSAWETDKVLFDLKTKRGYEDIVILRGREEEKIYHKVILALEKKTAYRNPMPYGGKLNCLINANN